MPTFEIFRGQNAKCGLAMLLYYGILVYCGTACDYIKLRGCGWPAGWIFVFCGGWWMVEKIVEQDGRYFYDIGEKQDGGQKKVRKRRRLLKK